MKIFLKAPVYDRISFCGPNRVNPQTLTLPQIIYYIVFKGWGDAVVLMSLEKQHVADAVISHSFPSSEQLGLLKESFSKVPGTYSIGRKMLKL